jgi:ABC-type uncharacterized transport system YnjBCD permease subunit
MLLNQIKLLQDLSWQEINPRLYSIAVCLLVVRVRCLWDVGAQCLMLRALHLEMWAWNLH